jgi:hypothetical protein
MNIRFVTRTVHAYLDYPVALALIGLPFVLGLGDANPIAKWLSVATGVAAFILTLLTEHETGVIRILPYPFHVAVDRLVGAVFIAAPFVFGFSGLDALYYWGFGATVLIVTFILNAHNQHSLQLAAA